LTVCDVPKVIQAKSIKTRLQLVCLATPQEREGQHCLAQFIANRGHKAVAEALAFQAGAFQENGNPTVRRSQGERMCCGMCGKMV